MPKGKGTYGSKVGRPKAKAKGYNIGGLVNPIGREMSPVAGLDPNLMGEGISPRGRGVMTNTDGLSNVPGFNAMDRRNVIPGMTGDMDTPIFMGGYEKGGKVEGADTDAPSGEEGGALPRKGPVQALQDASELDG